VNARQFPVHGAGLGLRRSFLDAAAERSLASVGFWEVAPENWIGIGGRLGRQFRGMTESEIDALMASFGFANCNRRTALENMIKDHTT